MSAVEQLCRMSGLPEEQVRNIWKEAKANQAVLADCPGPHDFSYPKETKFGERVACALCGGRVDFSFKFAYEAGLRHGRKYPLTEQKE
jgi:hypothetical protein